jgi:Domain of unknown function (DUF1906)
MKSQQAWVGARGCDCVTLLDGHLAEGLAASGRVDFVVQYLGSVTAAGLQEITQSGLSVLLVTYADVWDPARTVNELTSLGYPKGCTAWLDVEGVKNTTAATLIADINAWATSVSMSGWQPGLYVGANSLLTSDELTKLAVVRYWRGMSRVTDRTGILAEPASGYCCTQLFPTQTVAGVSVDINVIGQDWEGRLPSWCTAS